MSFFQWFVLASFSFLSQIPQMLEAPPAAAPTLPPTVSETTPSELSSLQNLEAAQVSRVVDGDTIELSDGRKLRYIGVNTPETKDPNRGVECFGQEASQYNQQLVEGKTVFLEKDVSETDRYGRLLRYVYLADGQMVNEVLVQEGYAQASAYPPDVKYQERFQIAETAARESALGLWSELCQITSPTPAAPSNTPTPTIPPKLISPTSQKSSEKPLPTATPTPKPQPVSQINNPATCQYSCSGPDRDCADFATHDQAQAFFNCCGFTAQNDPMRLDNARGVGNGIACESLP